MFGPSVLLSLIREAQLERQMEFEERFTTKLNELANRRKKAIMAARKAVGE